MSSQSITNRDLYDAISKLRDEITLRVNRIEDDVKKNTDFRNQMMGRMTVMIGIIGIAINWAWDMVFNRKS